MYDENATFDHQASLQQHDDQGTFNVHAMEMEQLQHHLNMEEMEHCYNNNNWQQEMSAAGFNSENHYHHHQGFSGEPPYAAAPDLLTMFPLPNPSISFSQKTHHPGFLASLGLPATAGSPVVYDPLLPLNLPPQPPLLRELFHSLPNGSYGTTLGRNGPLFGGVDEMIEGENHVGLYQNVGEGNGGVFEFTAGEMDCKNRDNGKDTKHFATERHRRVLLNDKYKALRSLVPNPSKNDRASVVLDAIEYINELKRSVSELKLLVEKKRCMRERMKRPKTEEEGDSNINESKYSAIVDMENPCSGSSSSSLRSSWLHRKSKNTEVDVRIIDDEVTVKLVQQKRVNCLVFVSRVLDELHLDLHHVAGGVIGDYYSFLFNSKICEGSIVYASAVANKLIEVVDKQYAAIPPTNSYN